MTKGYVSNLKGEPAALNVARYIHGKSNHFEVAIDPDAAAAFREGKIADIGDVLKSEGIFKDTKKGLRPTDGELMDAFGTTDHLKVAEIIVKKGLIQYSEKYREAQRDQKKKRLVDLIRINCIDAQTGHPLPPQRIENAFEAAKVSIKEGKTAEDQFQDIIKELRTVLPIKMDTKKFDLSIPMKFASSSRNVLKQFGAAEQEKWGSDGSLSMRINIPAGLSEEFFDKVNALTHGEAQIKEIR